MHLNALRILPCSTIYSKTDMYHFKARSLLIQGKQTESPGSSSPFEWTCVQSKRKEASNSKDRIVGAGGSGYGRSGGSNNRRTGNKYGNSGGGPRGKGQNFKYGRSVSDNTGNRNRKQNDFDTFRRTASEGSGRPR